MTWDHHVRGGFACALPGTLRAVMIGCEQAALNAPVQLLCGRMWITLVRKLHVVRVSQGRGS